MSNSKLALLKTVLTYSVVAVFLLTTVLNLTGVISLRIVSTSSMQGTIDQGSLVLSQNWLKPKIGEIAIYRETTDASAADRLVVHRVIAGNSTDGFIFQGDNNQSADPKTVMEKDVVGVVAFWIPGFATLMSWPVLLLLVCSIAFVIAARRYFGSTSFDVSKLPKWVVPLAKKLLVGLASFIALWLIFAGLAISGIAKIVHPQAGPKLPFGTSEQSLAVIHPTSEITAGSLALAQIAGRRHIIRIEELNGSTYRATTMIGNLLLSKVDVEGSVVFFLPYAGIPFQPFDH